MNYDYEPMTEERAQQERYQLLPDGKYKARVSKSDPKLSANNNSMAELTLDVFTKDRTIKQVKDFLLWTPSMAWKMRHFCMSAGLTKEYDSKQFRPELAKDKFVNVEIKIEKGKEIPLSKLEGKAPGSKYPDKNVIVDYVVDQDAIHNNIPLNHESFNDAFNDQITF